MAIVPAIFSESLFITAIGIHHVDFLSDSKLVFKVPLPTGTEDYLFTIGRPRGMPVTMDIVSKVLRIATIGVHYVDFNVMRIIPIPIRMEGNPFAIR